MLLRLFAHICMSSFRRRTVWTADTGLLLEHLFNLADFLLDLARDFFGLTFSLQIGVVSDLSHFLLDSTFQIMKLSFDLILRARLPLVSPGFSQDVGLP